MDLQAVLLAPAILASAVYYKTKLCCHNFTMYDIDSKHVMCYFWHEAEGGLTANCFASCVCDYLEKECSNTDADTIILYSDGCDYVEKE